MPEEDDTVLNDTTTSTDVRWKFLGSLVTAIYLIGVLTLVAAGGLGIVTLAAIPQGWFVLISTLAMMAGAWLWGIDTYKEVSGFGKDSEK